MPSNTEEMRETIAEFEVKYGMKQAFGCIDGTHVPIKQPRENSQDYRNYKEFFSLNVQAVCNAKGYFMDVDCRWPGSVHDAKVFANSYISKLLRSKQAINAYQSILETKTPPYLIGDPAYPLTPFCMKEYSKCSSNQEVIFNNLLRPARNPIECAFGRLKARWQVLQKGMDLTLDKIPMVIMACFVLHNFCERNKVGVEPQLIREQIEYFEEMEEMYENEPDPVYSFNTDEGEITRRLLTSHIASNLPGYLL